MVLVLRRLQLVCLALLAVLAVCQDEDVPELTDGLRNDREWRMLSPEGLAALHGVPPDWKLALCGIPPASSVHSASYCASYCMSGHESRMLWGKLAGAVATHIWFVGSCTSSYQVGALVPPSPEDLHKLQRHVPAEATSAGSGRENSCGM